MQELRGCAEGTTGLPCNIARPAPAGNAQMIICVDPMDIEEKYGTDALRFVMASLCTDNQDVRLPVKKEKQPDGREINTSDKYIG